MKKWIFVFAAFCAADVFACEGLRFRDVTALVDFDGRTMPGSGFDVVARTAAGGCRFFVTFGPGGALSTSTRRLSDGEKTWFYNLFSSPDRARVLRSETDAAGAGDVIAGAFTTSPGGSAKRFLFYAALAPAPKALPPGEYRDGVAMTLWRGDPPNGTFADRREISLRATRTARIAAAIDPKTRELTVEGNVPAAVALSSRKTSRRSEIDAASPVPLPEAAAKAFGKIGDDEITVVIEAKE